MRVRRQSTVICGDNCGDALRKTRVQEEISWRTGRNTGTGSGPRFRESVYPVCFWEQFSLPLNPPFVPKNLHRANIKIEYGGGLQIIQ